MFRPRNMDFVHFETRKASFNSDTFPFKNIDALAESGFYYSSEAKVAICFYCSVCIDDWCDIDVPYVKHAQANSNCRYLCITKGLTFIRRCSIYTGMSKEEISIQKNLENFNETVKVMCEKIISEWMEKDFVKEIINLKLGTFDDVQTVHRKRFHTTRKPFQCFADLYHALHSYQQLLILTENKKLLTINKDNSLNDKSLLCKICLNFDIGVVLIPCGHQACFLCSQQIDSCHICRRHITEKINTFFT